MIKNFFKIAWRTLVKHKLFALINMAGLSVGMAVALLVGLWSWDELTYNQSHAGYERIARVMQHKVINGVMSTHKEVPIPVGDELRALYRNDFRHVVMSSGWQTAVLRTGDKKFTKTGYYFEPGVTELLSLEMTRGTRAALREPASVLLSASLAHTLFGGADPLDKVISLDKDVNVKVTGVYEDLPLNSEFRDMAFIGHWELYLDKSWAGADRNNWGNNSFFTYVQVADQADMDKVSAKIRNVKFNRVSREDQKYRPQLFLHPMDKWHLYSDFENGVNTGGRIGQVSMFVLIGGVVLLLACINFMNLVTARSEKRAREVGVRKTLGARRQQLVIQFFTESLLITGGAFVLAFVLVLIFLPYFNEMADKQLGIYWTNPWFWLAGIGFTLLTGLIAGSYPAFYLSSFQPIKVLKGTFRVGRLAALPRKALVILQFAVSIALIVGVLVIFRQIRHTQYRPVGYDRNGLVMLRTRGEQVHQHFEALGNDLKSSGSVSEVAESYGPLTSVAISVGDYEWQDKDPNLRVSFATIPVSYGFGRAVGWKFVDGRDFSRQFASDSTGFVLNEAAVKVMGLQEPVGALIRTGMLGDAPTAFKVIGVVKDMVMESPYEPVRPTVFLLNRNKGNFVVMKIAPGASAHQALAHAETVLRKYAPDEPFEYSFVDKEYEKKFGNEARIGKLAACLAALAIFISCIGLFGMASFIVEQRVKEIGVRKVLGASVLNLWVLLTKDFLVLIVIAALIATPVAYLSMDHWLQQYTYRAGIPWWVFAVVWAGALGVTLCTVSYQAIHAAFLNPVKSLKTE
jgi:ABC-type antimicrobial peptide transport system permease subunit